MGLSSTADWNATSAHWNAVEQWSQSCPCSWPLIFSAAASRLPSRSACSSSFENWRYTATYMADARAMALPLITTGDPDFVEHDRTTIFSSLGLLRYDTAIGGVVRGLGWVGMPACVIWLGLRSAQMRLAALGDSRHVA